MKKYIQNALQTSKFAVLATEGGGQPHASLIAITPLEGYRQLIFATYRSTRKYHNLANNDKVALLIDGGTGKRSGLQEDLILTAFGQAVEIDITTNESALLAHLERHPDLKTFLKCADCAIFRVMVRTYQVVHGIDEVKWWTIDDLDAN